MPAQTGFSTGFIKKFERGSNRKVLQNSVQFTFRISLQVFAAGIRISLQVFKNENWHLGAIGK